MNCGPAVGKLIDAFCEKEGKNEIVLDLNKLRVKNPQLYELIESYL